MKIKTSELTGAALDWAVAKCEGQFERSPHTGNGENFLRLRRGNHRKTGVLFSSTDWSQGGPIIEREGILTRPLRRPGHVLHGKSLAMYDPGNTGTMVQWVKRTDWPRHYWQGPTTLVAAMRCYVASKLGDEVEVPDELA